MIGIFKFGTYGLTHGHTRTMILRSCVKYCTLVVILFSYSVHGITKYTSCADVAHDGTSKPDGEYDLFLENGVGVQIYCKGLHTGNPAEYLTLRAGKSKNFAYFYENVGASDSCADKYPKQLYQGRGRSEFTRIKIDLRKLVVDINDFTFANQTGDSQIRYGTAGDSYTSSGTCQPKGAFQVDLEGTPFSVTKDITWQWTGTLPTGSSKSDMVHITNSTYMGCWIDKVERLLPSGRYNSDHSMTIEACRDHCRNLGFLYAGIQYSVECHCGNNYDRYGSAPDSQCDKHCSGDPAQICGGTWKISVYATVPSQNFIGRCGGFPGRCFPAKKSNPTAPYLSLELVTSHACLTQSPCQNEGLCVATSMSQYKCVCYTGYTGVNCERVAEVLGDDNSRCPAGYQAETCMCSEISCIGARFEGDVCVADTSHPQVICRPGDPGHVILFNREATQEVSCPDEAEIVGCSFRAHFAWMKTKGQGEVVTINGGRKACRACQLCKVQARCKQIVCGCKNGAHCNAVTGECVCPPGFYGNKCETFDYCSYYEDHNNATACGPGGICSAIPRKEVKAFGGDQVGDTCVFPFVSQGNTFSSCINDNTAGPPFACGGLFDKSSSYIDLGKWSPGMSYSVAAWVRPDIIDTVRRTIVGGVSDCNDFGFNLNSGTFRGFLKMSQECTKDLDAGLPMVRMGEWYMVAVTSNESHASIYLNGELKNVNTVLLNHIPTSSGFRIGGEVCCPNEHFSGMIKTVKVWNRAVPGDEITASMNNYGTSNSTQEALYGGLVGHWELAEEPPIPKCLGTDHGGEDWVLTDGQSVYGVHCNISMFKVPKGMTASIARYDGSKGGTLDVTAQEIRIEGYLDGTGAGYRGGSRPFDNGEKGHQGESYIGMGGQSTQQNRGGGGAGEGGSAITTGGTPGGGGGYGTGGSAGGIRDAGAGGAMYGGDGSILYMGSGGGSGGNARDMLTSPKGGRGGNGGAAIRLTAERTVVVKGTVSVKGGNGQGDTPSWTDCIQCPVSCNVNGPGVCQSSSTTECWDTSGSGGGGSGGSIFVTGKLVDIGYNKLWTMGGKGGGGANGTCGGNGGAGRIVMNAVVLRGSVDRPSAVSKVVMLSNKFMDYSQQGQNLIDYRNTVYGNEVYRGCFVERTTANRKLGHQVTLTAAMTRQLTPDYCKQQCRRRGFRYSGTQTGNECFCDNHLDASVDKTRDIECNMSCSGNPLMLCGGFHRIQVFGPPPSEPAAGNTVVPTCQSWCATADPFADKPKWGQCSSSITISDWDVHCECPHGYIGANCDELCSAWTYGRQCSRNCTCNQNTTAVCNPNDGSCECLPGYQGPICNSTCPQGLFGQNCQAKCNCSANTLCDPVTGSCVCKPGWMGKNCNFPCPPRKFGVGCNLTCHCARGSCSPADGTCECDPGYKLPFCFEKCDRTNYGKDCEQYCDCNGQPCHYMTGECKCGPGFLGHKCKILCPHGSWGQDCKQTCDCQGEYGCDHMTGQCICGPGYIGERCHIACPHGSFGKDCVDTCPCVDNQSTICDPVNGACICVDGYKGRNCEQSCDQGFYGRKCQQICTCLHGSTCKTTDGTCSCSPGFIDRTCSTVCPPNFFGHECQGTCGPCLQGTCSRITGECICQGGTPCTCPAGFWGTKCNQACSCVHGTCNPANGQCTCSPGWSRSTCDQPCTQGNFGQGCSSVCTCVHGSCDPVTGFCTCEAGFSGTKCNTPCSNGTYGPDCRFACSPCGPYAFPSCDSASGKCVCSAGFTGPLCDRPCLNGKWGNACSMSCSCINGGYCESVSGACVCKAGYTGVRCQNKCPKGTWGTKCSHTCSCGPHGVSCTPDEGICQCGSGYTGVMCRQSCDEGFYGTNCSQQCRCQPSSSYCSPLDGSCQCKVGYAGQMCDNVCPQGKWGRGCTQICQCNQRGSCNPFNGQCDCDKGSLGTHCEQQCQQDRFWGKNCDETCNCNGAYCDHRDGTCRCSPGKIGLHCELTCDSRHFGFQCAQLCACQNGGVCDHVTGSCRCQPGWSGEICDEPCPVGRYGTDCSFVCKECLNDGTCDTFSGMCLCPPGFTGNQCNSTLTIAAPTNDGKQTKKPTVAQQTQVITVTTGINFTSGQLAGLIIGMMLFTLVIAVVVAIAVRFRYLGNFGRTEGAVKFQGDEVEISKVRSGETTKQTTSLGLRTVTDMSFANPVHDLEERNMDNRSSHSEASTVTSGIASCMVDSDEEDQENFFKDSAA